MIVYGEQADLVDAVLRIAEFFRDESCGQCVPCRIGTVRQEEALHRLASGKPNGDELAVLADLTQVMRDASICGLGQTAANAVDSAIHNLGVLVKITIDGVTTEVAEGSTILDAARQMGIDTPTLCYGDTLTPVNVCRVCVVELENARTLVPACSRKVEDGMVVHTDSERVRTSRRLVLELLGSATDLSTAPEAQRLHRAVRRAARPLRPDSLTVAQAVKLDNELYVRDYSKCILCYKCVEACGVDHQNTFAITVAGRGFGPTSRPSSTCRCPSRRASTAATASPSARPAR